MTIKIELQPQVFQRNLDNMLYGSKSDVIGSFKGVPVGKFTNIDGTITQYSTALETGFRITTDTPGVPHTLRAVLTSNTGNLVKSGDRVVEKSFVPVNNTVTVSVALMKGENQIEVFNANDAAFTSVIASHAGTFLTTYARELFASAQNPLDEQTRALFSSFSSRMTEILIPFQDLYADPKSLRTLISRFVTRAYVTKSGSTDGVRDFATAILGTTPIFVPTQTDQTQFEPDVVPLFRSQLEFGGYEAHAWIPNYEISHWLTFIKLLDSARNFYKIEEVGEHEVLILADGVPEVHRFNFDDPSATAYSEFNFTDFRVVAEILSRVGIRFCAAGYPLDLYVTKESPLGQKRLVFDSSLPFDSGESLDGPSIDPTSDGWVGLSLSGRFENYANNVNPVQFSLDSLFIAPSPTSGLPDCVYPGFFTQVTETFSQYIDVLADGVIIDGEATGTGTLVSADEFLIGTVIDTFSDFSEFSLGAPAIGSISQSNTVTMLGTSSVRHSMPDSATSSSIIWEPATALDLSDIGADILYLSAYIGEAASGASYKVDDIPAYPGNLSKIQVKVEDSAGDYSVFEFHKENFKSGANVLPIYLDFPVSVGGPSNSSVDRTNITKVSFYLHSAVSAAWSDVYLGGLHVLRGQAYFRPARAKIELLDINGVFAQDLYNSELRFADHLGDTCTIIADQTYNNLPDNVYIPKRYKVELEIGAGTEGFDRVRTANNLRSEIGRQLELSAASSVALQGAGGKIDVNVFSRQFSPTGNENMLEFHNPNLDAQGNPVSSLLSITSFAGGSVGEHTKLAVPTGAAIAQQFTLGTDSDISLLELLIHRVGDPRGTITVAIHKNRAIVGGDEPGALLDRSDGCLSLGINTGAPVYTSFRLSEVVTLAAGTYWIVLGGDTVYNNEADATNYILWAKEWGVFTRKSAVLNPNLGIVGGSLWYKDNAALENYYFKAIG